MCRLGASIPGNKVLAALADSMARGEGDLIEMMDAVDEARTNVRWNRRMAGKFKSSARYLHDLAQRLERLRQYIVDLPTWREKVHLRQHRLERWTRVRQHTNAKVTPWALASTVSATQAANAAKRIQVHP